MLEKEIDPRAQKMISKASLWATLILFLIAVLVGIYFHRSATRALTEEVHYEGGHASRELAVGVKSHLEARVGMIHAFAKTHAPGLNPILSDNDFDRAVSPLVEFIPEFYTVNWIDAEGVIRKVHPLSKNRRALNEKAIDRPDISPYMIRAKADRKPMITPFINTYQGIQAIAIYVPLWQGDRFHGFMNALLDYRQWLAKFLAERGYHDYYIRICWESDPFCFEFGERPDAWTDPYSVSVPVLNQVLKVESYNQATDRTNLIQQFNRSFSLAVGVVVFLFGWLILVALRLRRHWLSSVALVNLRNASLRTLINTRKVHHQSIESLVGDTTLGMGDSEPDRIIDSSRRLYRDLEEVERLLGITQGGSLLLTEFSLQDALSGLGEKRPRVEVDSAISAAPKVVADRDLFSDCVLAPLLDNAAGFVGPDAVIKVRTTWDRGHVTLTLEVPGAWNQMDQITREIFTRVTLSQVRPETWDRERLRLYNAAIYCEAFKGSIDVEFVAASTRVSIHLPRSSGMESRE